jgi:hypothetical protein
VVPGSGSKVWLSVTLVTRPVPNIQVTGRVGIVNYRISIGIPIIKRYNKYNFSSPQVLSHAFSNASAAIFEVHRRGAKCRLLGIRFRDPFGGMTRDVDLIQNDDLMIWPSGSNPKQFGFRQKLGSYMVDHNQHREFSLSYPSGSNEQKIGCRPQKLGLYNSI